MRSGVTYEPSYVHVYCYHHSVTKIHLQSNRGEFAMCGAGFATATVSLTESPDAATCKNCLRVNRTLERDRRLREVARQALHTP